MEAVGADGAGGGGGGGGCFFPWQADSAKTAPSATTRHSHFIFFCFTLFPPCDPEAMASVSDEAFYNLKNFSLTTSNSSSVAYYFR
jgi:hypothetical protein